MFQQSKMLGNCQSALAQYLADAAVGQVIWRIRVVGALAEFIVACGLSCVFISIGAGYATSVFGDLCGVFDAQFESVLAPIFLACAWLRDALRLDNDEFVFFMEIH